MPEGAATGRRSVGDALYPYATGDRLEDRNTYFYTPFGGVGFLRAWRSSRAALALPAPAETGGLASIRALDAAELAGPPSDAGRIHGDDLVRWIAAGLRWQPPPDVVWAWLWRLHHKLEVGKRIYDAYHAEPPYRPVPGAGHRDAERYVLAAEVLDEAYERTRDIRLVNALLKVNDVLTSEALTLTEEQGGRLARLLAREDDHVRALALREGV